MPSAVERDVRLEIAHLPHGRAICLKATCLWHSVDPDLVLGVGAVWQAHEHTEVTRHPTLTNSGRWLFLPYQRQPGRLHACSVTLPGPLADDLWRIDHEDTTGRLWVDEAGMSLGLAAALLGELWLGRHIRIGQGGLQVAVGLPLPAHELTGSVVRLLLQEQSNFELSSWLAYLARTSYERVTQRMAATGHIQRRRRHLVGSAWLPTYTKQALAPLLLLRQKLRLGHPLVCYELALAGLMSASGLQDVLLYGASEQDTLRDRLGEWLRWSDMPPALGELLSCTRAAVGREAMTGRAAITSRT